MCQSPVLLEGHERRLYLVQPRPPPPGPMPEMPPSYLLLLVRYRAWPLPASLQTVFETLALRAELEALLRLLCMMGCQLVVLPFSLSALSAEPL